MSLRWLPVLALPFAVGCTKRLLEIRSTPPAAVYIDGELRGETPHTERYVYYGTREIVLARTGYRSYRKLLDLDALVDQRSDVDLGEGMTAKHADDRGGKESLHREQGLTRPGRYVSGDAGTTFSSK